MPRFVTVQLGSGLKLPRALREGILHSLGNILGQDAGLTKARGEVVPVRIADVYPLLQEVEPLFDGR